MYPIKFQILLVAPVFIIVLLVIGIGHLIEDKPHYNVSECYENIPEQYDTIWIEKIVEIGKKDYLYYPYYKNLNKYLDNPNSPDHLRFDCFETIYPKKVECPNAPIYVIKE